MPRYSSSDHSGFGSLRTSKSRKQRAADWTNASKTQGSSKMAVETRSLKAFSSQPAEEALDTRAIIWHVFCHVSAAFWFSLSWLHPVTLFEVIWRFHLGIYRSIPAITSVLYPRRRRLLCWIRSQVPSNEISDLAAVWHNGALLCALVEASVAPDPQLGCRFDKYRCSAVPSMKLGQKLAAEYLRVNPEFTESELEQEMTPAIMTRLVEYLSALQHAAILLKEGCHLTVCEEQPEVTARGMGLVMAVQGRRATFSIYPVHRRAVFNSHFDSLLVQINGPKGDTGSVLITQYNSQAHHTPGGLRRIIPIHVTVTIECARITYTPLSSGLHELSLLFRGNHIANSPHKVTVEPRGLHSELNVIPRPFVATSHILSRTVDFITEKRILTDDGRLVEINQQPTSFLGRQMSLRKKTRHVMAKRKIIGRRKIGNKSVEDCGNEKCTSPVKNASDVKIIVHEIEDRRRKSITPPIKTDFKDSCKKILWMCDLLLKNNSKDNSLRILNTAENILSHGKNKSVKEIAPSPMSERALSRLKEHLHANSGGLNDVTNLESSEVKKNIILKGLTETPTQSKDELKILPPENFTIESLPISPTKSNFSSLTNLNKQRRCSEPIEVSRKMCGFEELDEIVYSDYCIVNISPISERKSEQSTPTYVFSEVNENNTEINKSINENQVSTSENKENDSVQDSECNEQNETKDKNNIYNKENDAVQDAECSKQNETEVENNISTTTIKQEITEQNVLSTERKDMDDSNEKNIANNTQPPLNTVKSSLKTHPTLEESKILADIAVENYDIILKSTNLEEALKHFDSSQLPEDTKNIKIEDWMGPAEKEIWTNELKWYESENSKQIKDEFSEASSKMEVSKDLQDKEIDIQTCFNDIDHDVANVFLEKNRENINYDIAARRQSFKNSKSDTLEKLKSKMKILENHESTVILSQNENIVCTISEFAGEKTPKDTQNSIVESQNSISKKHDNLNLNIEKTAPIKTYNIDDEALAIIENFTTSICESISPMHSAEKSENNLVECAEEALLLFTKTDVTEGVEYSDFNNTLKKENKIESGIKIAEENSTQIKSLQCSSNATFINSSDNKIYDDKPVEQNVSKCFQNLKYDDDCEEKFNEIIANEQIDSLTSENTEESLKEFELIYQESVDEIDPKVAKEIFPEVNCPEVDLVIFEKLRDGMNKLAEATRRLSKSLPHETFIRETEFSKDKFSIKPSRSLSIFTGTPTKKFNYSRNLLKGKSLEGLAINEVFCESQLNETSSDIKENITKHTQNNDEEILNINETINNEDNKTLDEMDTIIQVTRRLSVSLIKLSNQPECLRVPEYDQLLSHSPDIASIGTPERSQQLSPCPQSPDLTEELQHINILKEESSLQENMEEIIEINLINNGKHDDDEFTVQSKIELNKCDDENIPKSNLNMDDCDNQDTNQTNIIPDITDCILDSNVDLKSKPIDCNIDYENENKILSVSQKELQCSQNNKLNLPVTVEDTLVIHKHNNDTNIQTNLVTECMPEPKITNENLNTTSDLNVINESQNKTLLETKGVIESIEIEKSDLSIEENTDTLKNSLLDSFVLDNIATLKENYPLTSAPNLVDNNPNMLNNNVKHDNKENSNIVSNIFETRNENIIDTKQSDTNNFDIQQKPREKIISQDSLTKLLDEIERDKNYYHASIESNISIDETANTKYTIERSDSIVSRRKSFWNEKILSEDDGTSKIIEPKSPNLPKSLSNKATGIVAKSLKCFEQSADGCFHARRAWASPNVTPESDTPPLIAPDLISSQYNTSTIIAPEIIPRKIINKTNISSKLSIFENNKVASEISKVVSKFDTPDIIKTDKEKENVFSTVSNCYNSKTQSLPAVRPKPLERKKLEIFNQDTNNVMKETQSKVHKKFSFEANKFAKRIENTSYKHDSKETHEGEKKVSNLPSLSNNKEKKIPHVDKTFGNTNFDFKNETIVKKHSDLQSKKLPFVEHASQSADSKFGLLKKKDTVLEKKHSLESKSSLSSSIQSTINDAALKTRKSSVALTKQLLDQNIKLSQSNTKDQSLFHTVNYTMGETKISIVPPREKSLETKSRPRRMSLLKMFSIEVTPSLEIETNFVNPLCDLNADTDETPAPPPPPILHSSPLKKDGDTQERFNKAKNFFKTLESKDTENIPCDKQRIRGSSLGRIGGIRTKDQNKSEKNNIKKFCSERQPKSVSRFHVKDLFKDVDDKTVGARGIPNPLAVVASLNSAVAEHKIESLSSYDLTADGDVELPKPENIIEEEEVIEPESTGLQRRGSLERRLSFKRLAERSTAEMF